MIRVWKHEVFERRWNTELKRDEIREGYILFTEVAEVKNGLFRAMAGDMIPTGDWKHYGSYCTGRPEARMYTKGMSVLLRRHKTHGELRSMYPSWEWKRPWKWDKMDYPGWREDRWYDPRRRDTADGENFILIS